MSTTTSRMSVFIQRTNFKTILPLLISLLLITACTESSQPDRRAIAPKPFPEPGPLELPNCSTEIIDWPKSGQPDAVVTCEWKGYRFTSTVWITSKGQVQPEYKVEQMKQSEWVKIRNSNIFNFESKRLEEKLNAEFQKQLDKYLTYPEYKECLKQTPKSAFTLDELIVGFNNDKHLIGFTAYFKTGRGCALPIGAVAQLPLEEVELHMAPAATQH